MFEQDIITLPKGFQLDDRKEIDRECPECFNPLRIVLNNTTGDFFIGCSNYPDCHYTANYTIIPDTQVELFG